MKPKVILQLYPMFPTKDEDERKNLRPLGRDAQMYQHIVHEWVDLLKSAEDMGVWGASTIEHHLHSEGYEVGPNPGVLNAFWAAHLKKMHVGALGYVMATQDPIRVAEETAIIDHLTKGRFFVGFARGYQSRWTNILGQGWDTVATVSDGSANDVKNRDMFEERVDMVLKCWTQDSVDLDGNYYKAPYPFGTGVEGYPAWKIANDAGAHGEIGPNGEIRKISVVPKPLQAPHPPVLIATSKSDDSIRGEKHNIVRWVHPCNTVSEYHDKLKKYDLDIYKNFYGPFFPQFPNDPNTDHVKNMTESGIFVGGTVDDVTREWVSMYKEVPAEYITLIFHYAQQPKDDVLRELELFMTKVLPELDFPGSEKAAQAAE